MSKELTISEEYLKELIDYVSSSTVGKTMKRYEILGGKGDAVKLATKELIYEGFRELRDLIVAHNKGRDITIFRFNKKPKNLNEQYYKQDPTLTKDQNNSGS